jgi:predicted TIM-barrel enzyme
MTTQFMFKIEPRLKKAAMKKAKEEGTTFSSVLNFATTAFVDGQLRVGLVVNEELNPRTKKLLREASEDYRQGKNISPAFSNAKDAIAYLKSQTAHARKVS